MAPARRLAVVSKYGCSDAGSCSTAEVMLPARLANEAPGAAQIPEPEATLTTGRGLTTDAADLMEKVEGKRESAWSGGCVVYQPARRRVR